MTSARGARVFVPQDTQFHWRRGDMTVSHVVPRNKWSVFPSPAIEVHASMAYTCCSCCAFSLSTAGHVMCQLPPAWVH